MFYEPSSNPLKESATTKPWTSIGKAKLKAEELLKALKGLPLIIVRPSICYGPGDIKGLAPRLCIAAVYKKNGQKLEYPSWFEEQKIASVHVRDVAKALHHLCLNGEVGKIYNLADKSDTTQKKIGVILEKIMGIKSEPLNALKSQVAKTMESGDIVNDLNDENTPIWLILVKEHNLQFSPLSPWLEVEALTNKSLSIDGSSIEATNFKYDIPIMNDEAVRNQILVAVADNWFPDKMLL